MKQFNRFIALSVFTALHIFGQDISGEWQGSLKAGAQELRVILQVARSENGALTATLLNIDQNPDRGAGMAATSFSLDGSHVKFVIGLVQGSYEGQLSADGSTITGTWTQLRSLPLEFRRPTKDTAWADPSPHRVVFIPVEKNVSLEVLDWGGTGRPLVLLAGLGNTAHVFDKFAPKLTPEYHVYGITRRGFGASSSPSGSGAYSADRLGNDVLAVLDALKINRPVLVGHSLAGEELSSVGSRHPERVAGLIYLEAAYSYAYYDPARGDFGIDLFDLQKKLEQMEPGNNSAGQRRLIEDLLGTTLPAFERDLKEAQKNPPDGTPASAAAAQPSPITVAIMRGMQKYTDIRVPTLAIYAVPHTTGLPFKDDDERAAADMRDEALVNPQARAFESGVPSARVVRLPHANHFVFLSNEDDVLREMNAFLSNLP